MSNTVSGTNIGPLDYRLIGGAGDRAREAGLVNGNWYRSSVPRATMKTLMQRTDARAIRDTVLWLTLVLAAGALAFYLRHTLWTVPAFLLYGALYAGPADSRWHESGHGTAFRSRWMNEALYQLASFMVARRPTVWRWSHARHHSDTLVTGRDPEISVQRPVLLRDLLLKPVAITYGWAVVKNLVMNAFGRISADEKSFIPATEWPKVVAEARAWVAVYAAVVVACVGTTSLWPALFIGLPSIYGAWLYVFFGLPQHAALPENTLDHRLNCRTIHMNPVFRFLYWNMNYHVEHHMFPMVPFHALPELHEQIKADCPPAYPNTWSAYKEMIPALLRQRRDPSYYIARPLPAKASEPTRGDSRG